MVKNKKEFQLSPPKSFIGGPDTSALDSRQKHSGMTERRGQSTVEYVLLVTAVIAVIMAISVGTNSPFQQKLTNAINKTTDGMGDMANRLMGATNP